MTINALAAAPAARAWLATTRSARVLNVFEHACNLVNPAGEVLSLVIGERGLTPFALLLPVNPLPLFSFVSPASLVRVEGQKLSVGPLTINWETARSWNPTPDWAALGRCLADRARLADLAAGLANLPLRGSLLELFVAPPQGSLLPRALAGKARPAALALIDGLRSASVSQASAGAQQLAGLGGGLTPAGDDFIVGALLAVWAGLYGSGLEELAGSLAVAAAQRTTTLSGAYLRAAARGECAAPWHGLFAALLAGEPASIRRALADLLSVGHTSGGDALAGFLAVHFVAEATPASY